MENWIKLLSLSKGGEKSVNGDNQQGLGGKPQEFPKIPQFKTTDLNGWGKKLSEWLRKNFSSIVLPVIALVVVAGGIYLYNRQALKALNTQEASQKEMAGEINESKKEELSIAQDESGTIQGGQSTSSEQASSVGSSENLYTEKAERSEGVTHLARKAVKKYLEESKDTISAEQKIYAEDFVKDRLGTRALKIGEEVKISKDLLKDSVNNSKKLTQKQLKNLTKYVKLVPSLR